MTRERLPSIDKQKQALQKKGIAIGRAKTPKVINRLYRYYIRQHHPKSDPRAFSYGMYTKIENRIEASKTPEKMTVTTGSGRRIKASTWVKRIEREDKKRFQKRLPPNVILRKAERYRTVPRIHQHNTWSIEPPLKATALTYDQAIKRAQFITNDIIDNFIHPAQATMGRFLAGYSLAGRIIGEGRKFEVEDRTTIPIVIPTPATEMYRPDYFWQRAFMEQGFVDLFKALYNVSATAHAEIVVGRVELEFVTNREPSNIDKLRL